MKNFVFILISLSLVATGCATLKQEATEPPVRASLPEAEALFSRLRSRNTHLHSFKGTGRLRIEAAGGIQQARFMWAGLQNDKLRLEVMGATGQPVFSFASNGERIYLISHTENRFYSKRESNANLEKLIALPITVSACLDLMAGRIPLGNHLIPAALFGSNSGEQILILKNLAPEGGSEHVFFDRPSGNVRQVETFDKEEDLVYRAEFVRMQHVSGFEVPRELRLSNDKMAGLQLVVDRFWPNVPVDENLFKLARPK